MIVGDKKIFAIQFEKTRSMNNSAYGKVLLFIGNKNIGYYEDVVNLSAVNYQLTRLSNNSDSNFPELKNMTNQKIFQILIDSDKEKYDNSIVSLAESFDDFDIRVVRKNEMFCFIWKLSENTFFDYPKNISTDIQFFEVSSKDLNNVLNEFSAAILTDVG